MQSSKLFFELPSGRDENGRTSLLDEGEGVGVREKVSLCVLCAWNVFGVHVRA